MNSCTNKKYNFPHKNWLSLLNVDEKLRKKTIRPTYSNLYAYAANNPVYYTDPDGRNEVPKLYQDCSAQEKVDYYLKRFYIISNRIQFLTNSIDTLKKQKKDLSNKRKEAYKDAFSYLLETSLSIIQIRGDATTITEISVQDLAEYCAEFNPDDLNKLNFPEILTDDFSYIKQKTNIDIEIFDNKRELKKLNKQKKEILSYLEKAIDMLYEEEEEK